MALPQLPPELWIDIFELATPDHETLPSSPRGDSPGPSRLLDLCLVSRHFCAIARPLTYKRIKVTRAHTLRGAVNALRVSEELRPAAQELVVLRNQSREEDDADEAWKSAISDYLEMCSSASRVVVCAGGPEQWLFSLDWLEKGKDTLKKIALTRLALQAVPSSFSSLVFPEVRDLRLVGCKPTCRPEDFAVVSHLPRLDALVFAPADGTLVARPSFAVHLLKSPLNAGMLQYLLELLLDYPTLLFLLPCQHLQPSNLAILYIRDVNFLGIDLGNLAALAAQWLKRSSNPRRLVIDSDGREWSRIEFSILDFVARKHGIEIQGIAPEMDPSTSLAHMLTLEVFNRREDEEERAREAAGRGV